MFIGTPFPPPMCTRGRAGHAGLYGEPTWRAGQPGRHDRDQGRQRLPGLRCATGACRAGSTTRWGSGSGTAASYARTSWASAATCRACSRPATPRAPEAVHELTNPDLELERRAASCRPSRCDCAWSGRLMPRARCASGLQCCSYHRQPIQLPPRAAPRRGLPADARAARDRAEARAATTGRRPGRLLTGRPRRSAPRHADSRHARPACPRQRLARVRPRPRGAPPARSTWWWTSRSRRAPTARCGPAHHASGTRTAPR